MRHIAVYSLILVGALVVPCDASAQARVQFEAGAWFTALSQRYHTSLIQVQLGKTPEGRAIKAIFEDSLAAALPADNQQEAARAVALYILSRAAAKPALALVIVGWRDQSDGIPTAQTFRFLASELTKSLPRAAPQ